MRRGGWGQEEGETEEGGGGRTEEEEGGGGVSYKVNPRLPVSVIVDFKIKVYLFIN